MRFLLPVFMLALISSCQDAGFSVKPAEIVAPLAPACQFVNPSPSADLANLPVSSDVILWIDAGQVSQASGSAVSTWSDLSGNRCHLTQTDSTKQPTLLTNQVNGLPAIDFTANQELSVSLNSPANPPMSIYVVVTRTLAGGSETPLVFGPASDGPPGLLWYPTGTHPDWFVFNNSHGYWSTPPNAVDTRLWNSYGFVIPAAGSGPPTMWQNNGLSTDGDVTAIPSMTFDRLTLSTTSGASFAEVIIFNRELTGAEQILVKDYLRTKYNLP